MLRRLSLPILAALLLWPAAAPAQPPAPAKVSPRTVTIQVAFVTASFADVDNLGINFDLIPAYGPKIAPNAGTAPKPPTYLQFSSDKIVAQLYQTLTRIRGKVILLPSVTTPDDSPATIAVDASVPEFTSPVSVANGPSTFPHLTGSIRVQGTLTLTPHIFPNNFVSLEMQSPIEGGQPIRLKAVASADSMVIVDMGLGGSNLPILGNLFRTRSKMPEGQELLIFITPTIIDANTSGGQPKTVTP